MAIVQDPREVTIEVLPVVDEIPLQVQNSGQDTNSATESPISRNVGRSRENTPLLGNRSRHGQAGCCSKVKSKFKSRRCCLLSSKAALIILVCNLIVSFGLSNFLDPSLYATTYYEFIIISITYSANALLLFFYPLAGYLADVRWGRHKTVINSLCFTFWSAVSILALGSLAVLCSIPLMVISPDRMNPPQFISIIIVLGVLFGIPCGLGVLLILCSLVAFSANVIQYGMDQLHDAPTDSSVLYIHWLVWTVYFGLFIVRSPEALNHNNIYNYLDTIKIIASCSLVLVPLAIILLGIMLYFYRRKSNHFLIESGCRNPYKLVFKVVKFAKEHSHPVRRSAFTYCEDELPSRLDLGKEKYGGPFTTEEVENVKAFVGILSVLLTAGPILTADLANELSSTYYCVTYITPLTVVIIIPLYLGLLRPFIHDYIPGMLKRMGMGMMILLLSILCTLVLTLILNDDVIVDELTNSTRCANLQPYFPNVIHGILSGIGYMLFYIATYEFICAQSPHSMKGLLIGTFFAIKGVFQLIGVFATYIPISVWCNLSGHMHSSPFCGFTIVYYLINAVIALIGLIAFTYTARKYQYRQRDEPDNIYRYAEEYYANAQDEPNYDYDDYDNLNCETIVK